MSKLREDDDDTYAGGGVDTAQTSKPYKFGKFTFWYLNCDLNFVMKVFGSLKSIVLKNQLWKHQADAVNIILEKKELSRLLTSKVSNI